MNYQEYEEKRAAVMSKMDEGEKVHSSEIPMYDNSMWDFGGTGSYTTLEKSIGPCWLTAAKDQRHAGAYMILDTKPIEYLYFYRHHHPRGGEWDDFRKEVGDPRLDYARECGQMARRLKVPFRIVLAFKQDEKAILEFKKDIENAIKRKEPFDSHELTCGRARASAEMCRLGIGVASADPNRVKDFVLECLRLGHFITV